MLNLYFISQRNLFSIYQGFGVVYSHYIEVGFGETSETSGIVNV